MRLKDMNTFLKKLILGLVISGLYFLSLFMAYEFGKLKVFESRQEQNLGL